MIRILAVVAFLVGAGASALAGEPAPELQTQPPQMPQHLYPPKSPPALPNVQQSTEGFLLYCRTDRSEVVFFMKPDIGLVQKVSSFPKMTGALFVSDAEYILAFAGAEMAVPVEFVVSRYTGRLTAVADGATVVFTGICRKGQARALF